MLLRQFLLPGVILPALVAGVIACCDPALFRRPAIRAPRSGAAAIAAGWLAAFVAIGAMPSMPPGEVLGWLFWLMAAAGIVGILWEMLPGRSSAPLAVGLALAVVGLMLRPLVAHTWTAAAAAGWLLAATASTLVIHWGFDALAAADEGDTSSTAARAPRARGGLRGGWFVAGAATLLTVGAAATLGLSATARVAQLMGALTAGIGACVVARLIARSERTLLGRGATLSLALGYAGLLLSGFFYAELRWTAWLVLALAPAAAALAHRGAGAPAGRGVVAVLVVAAVMVALALGPAIWATATAEPGMYDY
ncbi:MAG TPA: hypothetical protein VNB06_19175 [Thermoanaerobaculia bacterium]|nr:hypothetical protein [Thermoanaerobaculia bacterium]